jgi:CDP-L-myo-inositol myo-inositolphosphotransferase
MSILTGGRSKALTALGGVPLVERAVRTLLSSGLERVVVIVGHQADQVANAARLGTGNVEVVHAPDWELGNGSSLAAARGAVQDEDLFVLMCGDHVFADGALESLVDAREPAVLVDTSPSPEVRAEGTRVRIRGGKAEAFGKNLAETGVDCGAFVLGPDVFGAQAEAAARGDHSLAGALTQLSRSDPVRAVPLPEGRWWQDVDTPEDLRAARSLVRRSLIKDSDGPIARYINRPISTRITMWLSPLRLAPNMITLFTFVIGFWAAWSLSAGRAVVGGILTQVVSVLDGVDGETARLHDRATPEGARIDGVCDRMVDAAVVAGLWMWIWDDPGVTFRVVMIVVAAIGWGVVSALLKRPTAQFEVSKEEEHPLSALVGGRDARMLLFAGGAFLEQPFWTFIVGFIMYSGSGLWRVRFVRRSKRSAPASVVAPDEIRDAPDGDLYEIG